MQLEELQDQWQRLDRKLDRSLALQSEIVRRVVAQSARRRVNRLAVWPALDVAFCAVVLLYVGSFLFDYGRDVRLAVPAVIVAASVLALLASSIRQLILVAELDWAGPVAAIQRSLDVLRVMKIRQFKWVMLLAPLAGFCGLVVGLHGLFDWLTAGRVNILDKFDAKWVYGNYVFGVLFVPVGYYLAGVLAARCGGYSWWKGVLDGISGTSLTAAAKDVETWGELAGSGSR